MWFESFWWNYDIQQSKEGIQEQNIPSFNDIENQVKEDYLRNQDKQWAKELALKQYNENRELKEKKKIQY